MQVVWEGLNLSVITKHRGRGGEEPAKASDPFLPQPGTKDVGWGEGAEGTGCLLGPHSFPSAARVLRSAGVPRLSTAWETRLFSTRVATAWPTSRWLT